MKKIMFNDRYGLTQAVLDGRKTQIRRIIRGVYSIVFSGHTIDMMQNYKPSYKVGEVVAVAQSYKDAGIEDVTDKDGFLYHTFTIAAWDNKMFVRSDLMPHRIRITNVRIERLQDISDADCLKEGIIQGRCGSENTHFMDAYYVPNDIQPYCTPREAFAYLIDKVSGKGTWESNTYVFVYDFELVK